MPSSRMKRKYFLIGSFFVFMQIVALIRNYSENYFYFFWYCDFVPILLAVAFFLKNTDFVKGLINIGLIPQAIFLIDFVLTIITGSSPLSITRNLSALNIFFIISTLFIHLSVSLAFLFVHKEKTDKKALYYSFFSLVFIYIATLLFTPPAGIVNYVYHAGNWLSGFVDYIPYYTELWIVLTFVLVVLPTYLIQYFVYKRLTAW